MSPYVQLGLTGWVGREPRPGPCGPIEWRWSWQGRGGRRKSPSEMAIPGKLEGRNGEEETLLPCRRRAPHNLTPLDIAQQSPTVRPTLLGQDVVLILAKPPVNRNPRQALRGRPGRRPFVRAKEYFGRPFPQQVLGGT